MADLWGESAGLLNGANSAVANMNQNAIRDKEVNNQLFLGGQKNLSDMMQQVISDQTKIKQQTMQNQAEMDREKIRQSGETDRNTVEITETIANGLAKRTGDDSWSKTVGQHIPASAYTALVVHGVEANKPKPKIKEFKQGDQSVYKLVYPDGTMEDVEGVGGPRALPRPGKSPEDQLNIELAKQEKAIAANSSKLLTEVKRGKLPDEAFGGKPGDLRALAMSISSGKVGGLDSEQQARVNLIGGIMRTMKEQNDAYNENRKKAGKQPVDLTGFGDSRGDDSGLPPQAIAALKQNIGKPVTFGNGQTWMIDKNGSTKRIGQ